MATVEQPDTSVPPPASKASSKAPKKKAPEPGPSGGKAGGGAAEGGKAGGKARGGGQSEAEDDEDSLPKCASLPLRTVQLFWAGNTSAVLKEKRFAKSVLRDACHVCLSLALPSGQGKVQLF